MDWERLEAELEYTLDEEHDRLAKMENDEIDSYLEKQWEKPKIRLDR